MNVFDNEYIKGGLKLFSDINFSPDFSDPQTKLSLILFSIEALVLVFSIILWLCVVLFKTNDKWGVKEQQNKNNPDRETYNYHEGGMNSFGDMKQNKGGLSVFITKFVFPVIVIFITIYVALSVFGIK